MSNLTNHSSHTVQPHGHVRQEQVTCKERRRLHMGKLQMQHAIFNCLTCCVTMVSDLHSERGRTELWLRSSITLLGRLMFSAHSFSDNVSHTSTVCTRDMIKHRYTTFCILYEIYFSAIFNYTSDLAINSPDTLKDHISECVTSFDTAGSTTVSQVT
jgi:hypothetical protein